MVKRVRVRELVDQPLAVRAKDVVDQAAGVGAVDDVGERQLVQVLGGRAQGDVGGRGQLAGRVPGDPSQVIYVWFDALANYITGLGFAHGAADDDKWWRVSDERVHVIGKGITRFHAIYWPAILLSAGQSLPTSIFVHDYLTVEARRISKSLGTSIEPLAVIERYGPDALRWWFLRDVPRAGDADFRPELIPARANDLADGLGTLINRTIALVNRNRPRERRSVARPWRKPLHSQPRPRTYLRRSTRL
jgi:hypothetical protein